MNSAIRKQKVLAAIVENYIATGEPVGSKALLSLMDISVSSATIRNEMADLTVRGYLLQPHTSAGRIPSQKGYRYYVDNCLKILPPKQRQADYIDAMLESHADSPENLLNAAATVVSEITNLAAAATAPREGQSRIARVKFVQTGSHTAMAVLVTSAGMVKTKLFRCEFVLNSQMLEVFEKALNEKLAGLKLSDITQPLIQTVAASFGELSLFMPSVLSAVSDAARASGELSAAVKGQIKLLYTPDIDFETARNVVAFLSKDEDVLCLFDDISAGTTVIIGKENRLPLLFNSSVVASRYEIENQPAGGIAVLGPLRMDYTVAASVLQYTANAVSDLLSEIIRV